MLEYFEWIEQEAKEQRREERRERAERFLPVDDNKTTLDRCPTCGELYPYAGGDVKCRRTKE